MDFVFLYRMTVAWETTLGFRLFLLPHHGLGTIWTITQIVHSLLANKTMIAGHPIAQILIYNLVISFAPLCIGLSMFKMYFLPTSLMSVQIKIIVLICLFEVWKYFLMWEPNKINYISQACETESQFMDVQTILGRNEI